MTNEQKRPLGLEDALDEIQGAIGHCPPGGAYKLGLMGAFYIVMDMIYRNQNTSPAEDPSDRTISITYQRTSDQYDKRP